MQLKECLELGKVCGLSTIRECIINVEVHASSLFIQESIGSELSEIDEDLMKLVLELPTTLGLELING